MFHWAFDRSQRQRLHHPFRDLDYQIESSNVRFRFTRRVRHRRLAASSPASPNLWLAHLPCHFVQPRDAVLNIGMRREEIVHPRARERVDDEEVGGSGIALGRRIGNLLGSA